jgi:hypothetical protein
LTSTLGTSVTVGDGDGDTTGGDGDGDGDTSPETTGPGDGDGDGDQGDGDGDCPAGTFNCPCDTGDVCDMGLVCENGICGLGGGDGDGDGDTGGDCNSYDPMMCPMENVLAVQGLEGNFCGCPCASDADCPMGPPGTQGACVLVLGMGMAPTNCGLICSVMNDACPAGASCKPAGQMDPDIGICTFP